MVAHCPWSRHGEEVAGDHHHDHQQRGQDRVPGHDQAEYQKEYLHDLLDNRVQRIARNHQIAYDQPLQFPDKRHGAGLSGHDLYGQNNRTVISS
jgi:hypothetical protein